MYQLIAFDMDGTLLTSQKKIAASSTAAIERACASDCKVVLSTGRSLSELNLYQKNLKGIRYGILANGSLIYDFELQKVLAKQNLPAQAVDNIREMAKPKNLMVVGVIDGQGYLQRSHLENIASYHMSIYTELYQKTAILVDDIYSLMARERANFSKINIYHLTAEHRDQSYDNLLSQDSIAMIKAEKSGLELMAAGVGKGDALVRLTQLLEIPLSQTIAVGDDDNDEGMIREAGLGIAMGNANPSIKSLADIIVNDNDSGGCAQAIDDYLLKKS